MKGSAKWVITDRCAKPKEEGAASSMNGPKAFLNFICVRARHDESSCFESHSKIEGIGYLQIILRDFLLSAGQEHSLMQATT